MFLGFTFSGKGVHRCSLCSRMQNMCNRTWRNVLGAQVNMQVNMRVNMQVNLRLLQLIIQGFREVFWMLCSLNLKVVVWLTFIKIKTFKNSLALLLDMALNVSAAASARFRLFVFGWQSKTPCCIIRNSTDRLHFLKKHRFSGSSQH